MKNFSKPVGIKNLTHLIAAAGPMMTLSMPVFYRHKFIGVVAMDMAMKELTNAVKNRLVRTARSHRLCGSW